MAEGRDRKAYRDKGKRGTTIKTVYGEVSYSRRVYEKKQEGGEKKYVYLLDETMQMEKNRAAVSKRGGEDSHDGSGKPVPGDSRDNKQHLRAEREPWRGMEPGAAPWGEGQ